MPNTEKPRASWEVRLGGGAGSCSCHVHCFLIVVPLLSSGFTSVTHVSARIFFVLFHIAVVIIIVK